MNNIFKQYIILEKDFQDAFAGISEILTTCVTKRGKASVMLHIETGHSNNCQIILKLFGYHILCNNLQHKKISSKFGGIWLGINNFTLQIEGRLG